MNNKNKIITLGYQLVNVIFITKYLYWYLLLTIKMIKGIIIIK